MGIMGWQETGRRVRLDKSLFFTYRACSVSGYYSEGIIRAINKELLESRTKECLF